MSEYIFEIILSNEKIFDMFSSVDHLGLNASTVEIKVKLCMSCWVVYTQKSFVPEIQFCYFLEALQSTKENYRY